MWPREKVSSFQHIPCIFIGGSFSECNFCWNSCPQQSFAEMCLTSLAPQLHWGGWGWYIWNDLGLLKNNIRITTDFFFFFPFRKPWWSKFNFCLEMKQAKKTQPPFSKWGMTGMKYVGKNHVAMGLTRFMSCQFLNSPCHYIKKQPTYLN